MEKPLKVNLHILSPVHIGCDDYYEPTSFKVDEKQKKLIEFDPIEFFTNLNESDRKDFVKICEKGTISSIIEIYKFISHREAKGREVEIPSKFLNHFEQVLSLPLNDVKKELNKFAIAKTAYNPQTYQPYIPGSSLKGSLRTAYLNHLANELKHRLNVEKPRELERKLLGGDFSNDPFRFIKISDFSPLQKVETKIFYAINKKKVQSKFDARGPYHIVETIKQGTIFEGTINIEKPQMMEIKEIKKDNLFKAANDFYKKILSDEEKVLKNIQINFSLDQKLNNFKDKIGKTAFLIRIGRHSGAEAVTIEGYRKIKIKVGKKESRTGSNSTTLWLCSEDKEGSSSLIPFGWAMLEVLEQ